MSPEPPNPIVGVGATGVIVDEGMMPETPHWLFQPGDLVMVAGFQNIEDRPPAPAATPAKASP